MRNPKLYLTGVATILLSAACVRQTIPPAANNCYRYAQDIAATCSLYDSLKNKWWTVDSVVINGNDYTQEVLSSIGGSYGFSISPNLQPMGSSKMVMAPAFIEDGLGRVVHCYWYDVKDSRQRQSFPLQYSGSPTSLPEDQYLAPLPLYFHSLRQTFSKPIFKDSIFQDRIISCSANQLKICWKFPDTIITNVFTGH
jgi:hypothetical protein